MSQSTTPLENESGETSRWYQATWVTVGRGLVAVGAMVLGLGMVLLTMALGHCSAFGGTCPRVGGFPDDLFWSAAFGGGLAVAVPYYLRRPSWSRLAVSSLVAVVVGGLIGLFAVEATAG